MLCWWCKFFDCSGQREERGRPFRLQAPEFDMEDTDSEDDEQNKIIEAGTGFGCNEIYLRCVFLDFLALFI